MRIGLNSQTEKPGPALPLEPTETQFERFHIAKLLAHVQF